MDITYTQCVVNDMELFCPQMETTFYKNVNLYIFIYAANVYAVVYLTTLYQQQILFRFE